MFQCNIKGTVGVYNITCVCFCIALHYKLYMIVKEPLPKKCNIKGLRMKIIMVMVPPKTLRILNGEVVLIQKNHGHLLVESDHSFIYLHDVQLHSKFKAPIENGPQTMCNKSCILSGYLSNSILFAQVVFI